jgi:hypothetical protein
MRRVGWTRTVSLLCSLVAPALLGCAGPVAVSRTYAPDTAERMQEHRMVPVALVRGDERLPLPQGARLDGQKVVLPHAHVHKLAPGDVIEQDEEGRIVAVRSAGEPPIVTRFVPGTAESPASSDVVRGELADDGGAIPLSPTDGVEMHGILSPDDAVSGVGHVESTRATGALVGGLVLLALSYGPSVYVGAQATPGYDRALSVPVAGPWLDLAQRPACVPPVTPYKSPIDPCLWETAARVALVTSGSVQGLGAILTLWGLPSHSRLVEGGDGSSRPPEQNEKRHVTVAVAPALGGLVLGGTF